MLNGWTLTTSEQRPRIIVQVINGETCKSATICCENWLGSARPIRRPLVLPSQNEWQVVTNES